MRRCLVAALATVALVLLPVDPAAAHGRKVILEVAGDGAAGVTVLARYDDGHPVDDRSLSLVLTATRDDGRPAGPVQLQPAPEGRGFYASGAVLTPGRWTVVITAPAPYATRARTTVELRGQQTPLPLVTAGPQPVVGDGSERGGGWVWWAIGLALAAAAMSVGLSRAARWRRAAPPGP